MQFENEHITRLIESHIAGYDGFLVDLVMAPGNKILVEIDTPQGVSIGQCADLNRYLNQELDNEANEFELTVSSPGLERPFKVRKQYHKSIGQQLKVRTAAGKDLTGILKAVSENDITIFQKLKEAPEGQKKREWVEKDTVIPFDEIKEAKIIITFK